MKSYVIAPQDWDKRGKGQFKLDVQVMCKRLSDYLDGHGNAPNVRRIPSPEEEAQGRLREQLRRQIRRCKRWGAASCCEGKWR